MSGRIVLFGATGHTGRLTAEQLVAMGARPLLVGRRRAPTQELAERLGGLEVAVADSARPAGLREQLGPGDVLISTVGPFARFGAPAVRAAIDAGAHYLDSTGEPAFVREVFQAHGPPAARAGVGLVTAFGYDFVPGNLAAAQALAAAGEQAIRVDVGYFMYEGWFPLTKMSGGTRASLVGALLAPSFGYRQSRLLTERGGRRLRHFEIDGRRRPGISIGTSEQFALPRLHRQLHEVNTYLGWFGRLSRVLHLTSAANELMLTIPGVRAGLQAATARLVRGSTGGPPPTGIEQTPSRFVAIAYDGRGTPLAERRFKGPDGYAFTCRLLARGAIHVAEHGMRGAGALGPVEAFGADVLADACGRSGLVALGGPAGASEHHQPELVGRD